MGKRVVPSRRLTTDELIERWSQSMKNSSKPTTPAQPRRIGGPIAVALGLALIGGGVAVGTANAAEAQSTSTAVSGYQAGDGYTITYYLSCRKGSHSFGGRYTFAQYKNFLAQGYTCSIRY